MNSSKGYFANVAEQWDELRAGFFMEAMRDAAIAKAVLRPADVVADVGTGTGFMAQALAPLVATLYGFDESPEMLEVARRNLGRFENVVLRLATGERIPLPDGELDAVFANMYLHHTSSPFAAIRELARVLRPGGQLVLLDLDTHDQSWMRAAMADQWLGFDRKVIDAWLAEAGFAPRAIDCAEGKCCTKTPKAESVRLSVFVAHAFKSTQAETL